jgi:hypothetical protein
MSSESSNRQTVEEDVMDFTILLDASMPDFDVAASLTTLLAKGVGNVSGRLFSHGLDLLRMWGKVVVGVASDVRGEILIRNFVPFPEVKPRQRIV